MLFVTAVSAYVGPGAGFGIVTSFLVILNALFASMLSALIWPVTLIIRFIKRRRRQYKQISKRVVVLGLDGFSPRIAGQMMDSGQLPYLDSMRKNGTFCDLQTTCPGISPVAWSSFQTGVNPGKHDIFDFLAPDRERYLPTLSSVKTGSTTSRVGFGAFGFNVSKSFVRLLRKSKPFWILLRKYGIKSTVLRVPITYPPESLDGQLLSGMCVPDLRGTQGSYTVFSEKDSGDSYAGGIRRELSKVNEHLWTGIFPGPMKNDGICATIPLELEISGERITLIIGDRKISISQGVLSEWVELTFKSGRKKIKAISRFCLTMENSCPSVYSTALHIDPFSPSLPISHPVYYSKYLAGLYGPFATLGLAEDTWALNNDAVSENIFLDQSWSIFEEREKMYFDALSHTGRGLVVCVFDTSDRIQHMFWGQGTTPDTPIHNMYLRMDELIGRTLSELRKDDMLIVMSDHGFTSFHTCIDFNRWLLSNGYLFLKDGVETVDTSFKGVDWSKTRAWSMGLAGIMLNIKGREGNGIVEPGIDAEELLTEIADKLLILETDEGERVINAVYSASDIYHGPYVTGSPDLVVGTKTGFRAGWGCVTGGVGSKVIYPNTRRWNGDHCHDHKLVPGTLASNMKLDSFNASILDIAPTILRVLGIRPPSYMDGKILTGNENR
ncbi:MAG: alkaline phosphatase family protein [Candidatus Aegiribacteria sp.]|nr:alkaline phosphatase family protein [Candidatus Aegiribacteria sp.]